MISLTISFAIEMLRQRAKKPQPFLLAYGANKQTRSTARNAETAKEVAGARLHGRVTHTS